MPSSTWMDDLAEMLKTMEPADVASMFAGARGSVPIYSGLYSKDASGPDELAFEARNRATSTAQRDAQYAAQMKAKGLAEIPEDALRKAVAARMQQEEQYPPALATRRADFVPQPRHEMRPFADGGAVNTDFTQPDMADGGAMIPDREYAGGGGVKKTLQEMADSLLLRGVKTADKPDLARRSLFGLKAQPALDLPLARIDDIEKSLTKDAGRDLAKAPAITEKTVTVDPGKGAAKSTLQSLVETPMSRRSVLQAAAGQVLRHAVPGLNEVVPTPDILGEIAKIIDVPKPAPIPTPAMIPGLVAKYMKQGFDEEAAVNRVVEDFAQHYSHSPKQLSGLKDDLEYTDLPGKLKYPGADSESAEDALSSPAQAWSYLTGLDDLYPANKVLSLKDMKDSMRSLRSADPDAYMRMRDAAKDFAGTSAEAAAERGEKIPFNVRTSWGGYGPGYKHIWDAE